MIAPRSYNDLMEITGSSLNFIRSYLAELHDAGVIYLHALEMRNPRGTPTQVWAMQTTPYAKPDATQKRSHAEMCRAQVARQNIAVVNARRAGQ